MVILVLALISVLVLSWGQEWRTELRLAANFREAHQCRRLAEAGVYYALGKLVSAKIEETALRSPGILQEAPAQPSTWHGDQTASTSWNCPAAGWRSGWATKGARST